MKLAGSAALVCELTRLTKLEIVNGREGLRQLLRSNNKVELQSTEIAVAVACLLPNSASTLTELDVRYSKNVRDGLRLTPFLFCFQVYGRTLKQTFSYCNLNWQMLSLLVIFFSPNILELLGGKFQGGESGDQGGFLIIGIRLNKNSRLTTICCSKCSIDAGGARELCHGLIHLTALQTLNLR